MPEDTIIPEERDVLGFVFPEIRNDEFEKPYIQNAYKKARKHLGSYLGLTDVENQSCDVKGDEQPALRFKRGIITRRRTTCGEGECDYRFVVRISPKGKRLTTFEYKDHFCIAL